MGEQYTFIIIRRKTVAKAASKCCKIFDKNLDFSENFPDNCQRRFWNFCM